jgi:hypothetical protein
MATYIMFTPALEKWPHRFEVRDFKLGTAGKGADGRGYPAHLRRLWVKDQHEAFVELADPVIMSEADRKTTPQRQEILDAVNKGKVFTTVAVFQPQRRVTMHNVKIARFTAYIQEPLTMELVFEQLSEHNN